ncbi:MAG: YtfJ family protein [Vibrio sp.]
MLTRLSNSAKQLHKLFLISTLAFASSAMAQIQVGQNLPPVSVTQGGEIIIQGSDVSYQNWNSDSMKGKVRVIQAIAGRSSAKEMNEPLTHAITAAKFDAKQYQTTTIVNQSDAIWGTGSFVKSSAESSKKEFNWSSVVLDEKGVVAKAWQLQPENSAIIVQDKAGKVLYFKEGKLDQTQIQQVLGLIKKSIN